VFPFSPDPCDTCEVLWTLPDGIDVSEQCEDEIDVDVDDDDVVDVDDEEADLESDEDDGENMENGWVLVKCYKPVQLNSTAICQTYNFDMMHRSIYVSHSLQKIYVHMYGTWFNKLMDQTFVDCCC